MNCPKCNSADILVHGKRNALYPLGLYAVVGLPFAMLHQASSPIDYHCNGCGTNFARRTKTGRVAWVCLVLSIVGLVVAAIASTVFMIWRNF
jgi:hypothetical protein